MTGAVRTLLSGLIDYAGLFPPAGLGMAQAAEAYARDRAGAHDWMLGRFICPATRLEEFTRAAAALMPGTYATSGYREHADTSEPWRVSVLADAELSRCLDLIDAFNEHHAREEHGLARADAIELKPADASQIDADSERIPEDLFGFFEIPIDRDCRGMVAALAGTGCAAKVRTGGVVPGAIPTTRHLADFLHACASADVAFKATAGLHHPVRAEQALTYEPAAPRAVMHGFLNLFLAAACVRTLDTDRATTQRILDETNPGYFRFAPGLAAWRDLEVDTISLAKVREAFALSFGSCSFDEPVADLRALGLL